MDLPLPSLNQLWLNAASRAPPASPPLSTKSALPFDFFLLPSPDFYSALPLGSIKHQHTLHHTVVSHYCIPLPHLKSGFLLTVVIIITPDRESLLDVVHWESSLTHRRLRFPLTITP
jgi:hypothetical protein